MKLNIKRYKNKQNVVKLFSPNATRSSLMILYHNELLYAKIQRCGLKCWNCSYWGDIVREYTNKVHTSRVVGTLWSMLTESGDNLTILATSIKNHPLPLPAYPTCAPFVQAQQVLPSNEPTLILVSIILGQH